MPLILDLTPEQIAHLQAEADQCGMSLSEYAQQRLLGDSSWKVFDTATRQAAIDTAMGSLAGSGISSEDFMREKQEEIEREEVRWQRLHKSRTA
jgi:hypothetical protein